MKDFIYSYYSQLSPLECYYYRRSIKKFVNKLFYEYPDFNQWYEHIFTDNGSLIVGREIIMCEYDRTIVGVIVLKKQDGEKKICTLRVANQFQKVGIGKKLIKMGFEWLESETPLMTVNSYKVYQFKSLIDYFGFELSQEKVRYYNLFSTELVFNGELPEKQSIFNRFEQVDIILLIKHFIKSGYMNFDAYIELFLTDYYKRQERRKLHINIF